MTMRALPPTDKTIKMVKMNAKKNVIHLKSIYDLAKEGLVL